MVRQFAWGDTVSAWQSWDLAPVPLNPQAQAQNCSSVFFEKIKGHATLREVFNFSCLTGNGRMGVLWKRFSRMDGVGPWVLRWAEWGAFLPPPEPMLTSAFTFYWNYLFTHRPPSLDEWFSGSHPCLHIRISFLKLTMTGSHPRPNKSESPGLGLQRCSFSFFF